MKIAVLKERHSYSQVTQERRVAATPDMVKKFIAMGFAVAVESCAGVESRYTDKAYSEAGATITDATDALTDAVILLCVHAPSSNYVSALRQGTMVIGMLSPYGNRAWIEQAATQGVTSFAMELMPRISRAQGMDVLSSQSNLAGYRAVIEALGVMDKATPMMMTAAGTVAPAKILVLGAGVAGLQAIATAKRMGAVVSAFDVRPAVKEQVESLGAKFIEVPAEENAAAETSGGYAREMSEDYKRRQAALVQETLAKQDVAITTALIPGRAAPVLITEAMVEAMKPGSVIIDLAILSGGNCPLSRIDEAVSAHGVTILAPSNLPGKVATDASALYARNLLNFVAILMNKEGGIAPDFNDELVKGTALTHEGRVIYTTQ